MADAVEPSVTTDVAVPERVRVALDQLSAAQRRDRLAHAYLIVGAVRGAGGMLAERWIQQLACDAPSDARPCGMCRPCRGIHARTWPDVHWVEPESKSRQLRIEPIRELITVLSKSALTGGWKVGVLLDADRLTNEAANAFLKTLEEPTPRTLLLLISEQPQALLPTILSRCQRINLGSSRPELPEAVQAAFRDWLMRGVQIDGPVTALGMGVELTNLLETVKKSIETETKAVSVSESDSGVSSDRDRLEARVAGRYREVRMRILESVLLWHRDVLVLRAGGASDILMYPEATAILQQYADRRSLAGALDAIDIIEQMYRQVDRSLPETPVFAYGLDRLTYP